MSKNYKKKGRKSIILSVIVAIILLTTVVGFASTKEVIIKHERLDTGVIFIWADGKGVWQNELKPNGSCNRNVTINIGKADFKNFKCEVYNGTNFKFGKDESTSHWNKTKKCKDQDSFNRNYLDYCSSFNSGSVKYDKSSGNLNIKESVTLTSNIEFDVAQHVRKGDQKTIYDYLGDNISSGITDPMNKMLTDPKVQGYLYFCPMVITYDEVKLIPFGTLIAGLDVPERVRVGESYTVRDTSIIEGDTLDHSELYFDTGNGRQKVENWDGSKLGSEIEVKTRRDPNRKGYFQLSYDGGKTWIDGGMCDITYE